MTDILPHTDKSMSQVIDAINAKFPELAGQGFDAYVSYIKIGGTIVATLSCIFMLMALIMAIAFTEEVRFLSFVLAFICACIFSCALTKVMSPEGYVVAQIVNGVLR